MAKTIWRWNHRPGSAISSTGKDEKRNIVLRHHQIENAVTNQHVDLTTEYAFDNDAPLTIELSLEEIRAAVEVWPLGDRGPAATWPLRGAVDPPVKPEGDR